MQVDEPKHFSWSREVESDATFIIIRLINIWIKVTSVNRVQSPLLHSKCIFKEEMSHRRTFHDLLPIIKFTSSSGTLPPACEIITHTLTRSFISRTQTRHTRLNARRDTLYQGLILPLMQLHMVYEDEGCKARCRVQILFFRWPLTSVVS